MRKTHMLKLSEQANRILEERYLLKDENGKIVETPKQLFQRTSFGNEKIRTLMENGDFLPNSPTLFYAGTEVSQLSACFVIPIEDNMESIMHALKAAAMVHKTGGGTGFSFSRLRPRGDRIASTGGVSSGAVSFMTIFDFLTGVVTQGGKRSGANMGIMHISHPEIRDFVKAKDVEGTLHNTNISVAVTNAFMQAVEQDSEFTLVNPRTKKPVEVVKAKELFSSIVEQAWKNGEPGIVFIDTINESHLLRYIGEIEATNPCGEQPLLPWESCNLGSINLSNFAIGAGFDFERFRDVVCEATKYLDSVIDKNKFALPEIEKATKANRKIGLGVMGFADLLLKLHIRYGSRESLELANSIGSTMMEAARRISMDLAKEFGTYPSWKTPNECRRNATLITIAPTGSISLIAGCSNGIEPVFDWTVERKHGVGEGISVHPLAKPYIDSKQELPSYFVKATEIPWQQHVEMQAIWQKNADNAVSKTIGLPSTATSNDISGVFLTAWKFGCKGVTVYRDQSREKQVYSSVSVSALPVSETKYENGLVELPQELNARRFDVISGCCDFFVIPTFEGKEIREIFISTDGTGGCRAQTDTIAILLSVMLRRGIEPELLVKHLKRIKCPTATLMTKGKTLSCPYGVGVVIESLMNRLGSTIQKVERKCPNCNTLMIREAGCDVCKQCGFTRC